MNPDQDDEDEDGVGDLCEGLSRVDILDIVTINPNPVSDILFVNNSFGFQYSIMNAVGQLVGEGSLDNGQISVQELNSGIYFILISIESEVRTFRFVKQQEFCVSIRRFAGKNLALPDMLGSKSNKNFV